MNVLPPKVNDLTGKVFGRWTVVAYAGKDKSRNAVWLASCVCGVCREVRGFQMVSGASESCGCAQIESAKARATHGQSGSPEYAVWCQMWQRCTNPNDSSYAEYCDRAPPEAWKSYENFIADMGQRPSQKHTLERADNSKGYSPENCYWATRVEQNSNKSDNKFVTFAGLTLTITEWSRKTNIPYQLLRYRLQKQKCSIEKVLESYGVKL